MLKEYKASYAAYYIQDLSKKSFIMYSNSFLASSTKLSFCNIIVRNSSMVIPLLANQDLPPMLS